VDSTGQAWTGVWSLFGHCLVIDVGEVLTVGFVGLFTLIKVRIMLVCQ